jgi:enoyl-CoA hydratase/carnithine racemase
LEEYETIVASVEEGVGRITINRPDSRNSLNTQVLGDIRQALAEFRHDENVSVVVFTGAGDRAFAAGADINELRERTMLDALASVMQAVYDEVEAFEKPTVAAVNGYALGGGCELAMACHLRVASEAARFGQPEVKLGIGPGYGGTVRLPRLVGRGRALELLLTGQMIDAQEAYRIGLVNRVVPTDRLLPETEALIRTILENGPLAVRACLEAVDAGLDTGVDEALLLEANLFGLLSGTADMREGTAAFLEKRKAGFVGR